MKPKFRSSSDNFNIESTKKHLPIIWKSNLKNKNISELIFHLFVRESLFHLFVRESLFHLFVRELCEISTALYNESLLHLFVRELCEISTELNIFTIYISYFISI